MKLFGNTLKNKKIITLLMFSTFIIISIFIINIIYNISIHQNIDLIYQTIIYYLVMLIILTLTYKLSIKFNSKYKIKLITLIPILSFIYLFYSTKGIYPRGHINDVIYILYCTIIIIIMITQEKYIIITSSIMTLIITYIITNPNIREFDILLIEAIYIYILSEISFLLSSMIQYHYQKYLSKKNIAEDIENLRTDNVNFLKLLIEYINKINLCIKSDKYDLEYTNLKILKRKLKDRIKILKDESQNIKKPFIFNLLIPQIISVFSPIITSKNLHIEYTPYSISDIEIHNDFAKIKSILFYIIENAVKFSDTNTTIVIKSEEKNGNMQIFIQNYSKTFNYNENIYDLSYSKGKNKGEGFGLFCAKKFADITKTEINLYKDYANLTTTIINIHQI